MAGGSKVKVECVNLPPPKQKTPPPPSKYSTTISLEEIELNSSPDANALHSGNVALNQLINNNPQNYQTPVCTYIRRLTKTSEFLSARTAILEKEMKEIKGVLSKRKERQKGKRNILKNVFVASTMNIYGKIADVEKETTRKKKATNMKKQARRLEMKSEDEGDTEDENAIEECDMEDCIVIEMRSEQT